MEFTTSIDFKKLEKLRYKVFKIDSSINNTYYQELFDNHKLFVIAIKENTKYIGAIYLTKTYNSIYIDKLFIDSNYHRQGLVTKLVNYFLKNSNVIKEYFHYTQDRSYVEPKNTGAQKLFSNLGYNCNNNLGLYKKRI